MQLLQRLKDVFSTENDGFSCSCGFYSESPAEDFVRLKNTNNKYDEYNKYKCPSCKREFLCLFCSCGNGFEKRGSIEPSQIENGGLGLNERFYCTCGNLLYDKSND